MSETSSIEWTDSTFNPWEGCQKVGPGCDNCYAETRNARFGGGQAVNWGPGALRRRTSVQNWNLPKRWNSESFWQCRCGWRGGDKERDRQRGGIFERMPACPVCDRTDLLAARRRVFCASLADVFDNAIDPAWRADLFDLIRATPNLDWLLLTKRISNVKSMLEAAIGGGWWASDWPNVWIGATVVNQAEADRDIPKLLKIPAAVRFLSIEPQLGRIDLCEILGIWWNQTASAFESTSQRMNPDGLDWVIVGGESGPGARPMHPDWARTLRDTCAAASIPLLFKQWGEWLPAMQDGNPDLPQQVINASDVAIRVGKKVAGRLLDGRAHDAFPGGVA